MKIEPEQMLLLQAEFKPQMDKLYVHLKKKGISHDSNGSNMYFHRENVELGISFIYLYRQSGISHVLEHVDEKSIRPIKVDNEMFYNSYVKSIIDLYFV